MSRIPKVSDPSVGAESPQAVDPFVRLRLTTEDIAALARQGFVSEERRRGRPYFKLRFRREGKQQVRCIGRDPEVAEAIRDGLSVLRTQRRLESALRDAARRARRELREAKRKLEPALQKAGFSFHGQAVRRSRRSHSD